MPQAKGPRESSLQAKCLVALRARGGWWQRKSGHSPYENSGIPDIYGCYEGRFIGIELKRPGAKRGATKTQLLMLQSMAEAGAECVLADTIAEVMAVLDRLDHEKWLLRYDC